MGRIFDVTCATAALVAVSPVLLAAAVAIKLDDGGAIIYRARRIGKDARPIDVYKFRSMRDRALPYGPSITARGDTRVTRVGRFLRRSKIDELPQLFNVLRGEMSIVGPRPEDPAYVAQYSDEQRRVLDVRPGMTSPASVRYRNEEDLLEGDDWENTYRTIILPDKLALELEYIDNRSIWTDLSIIWKTVTALFR